eukprot:COSAG04_NODE_268_length_18517_cov_9.260940_11_plen_178_part_00
MARRHILRHALRGLCGEPAQSPPRAAPSSATDSSHADPTQGGRHRPSPIWPGAWGDYEKDGYTVLPQVLDAEMMSHCAAHLQHLTERFPTIPTEHLHHVIYRSDAFWIRLVSDQRLLDCAAAHADFLDENITLFSSNFFCKQPGSDASVLWHQGARSPPFSRSALRGADPERAADRR